MNLTKLIPSFLVVTLLITLLFKFNLVALNIIIVFSLLLIIIDIFKEHQSQH
ncbi:hypothetical protein [Clostridium sp.]|uniref:hypothetical protein n=1 Tax=Clostridium sp. TaxID=1506 RepID=UPI003F304CF2